MILEQTIQHAAQLFGDAAKPAGVILFGSYARGDARENSELDFLVIEPELNDKFSEMVRLRQVLRPLRVPVDVLVYSQAEINQHKILVLQPCIGHCAKAGCYTRLVGWAVFFCPPRL